MAVLLSPMVGMILGTVIGFLVVILLRGPTVGVLMMGYVLVPIFCLVTKLGLALVGKFLITVPFVWTPNIALSMPASSGEVAKFCGTVLGT